MRKEIKGHSTPTNGIESLSLIYLPIAVNIGVVRKLIPDCLIIPYYRFRSVISKHRYTKIPEYLMTEFDPRRPTVFFNSPEFLQWMLSLPEHEQRLWNEKIQVLESAYNRLFIAIDDELIKRGEKPSVDDCK